MHRKPARQEHTGENSRKNKSLVRIGDGLTWLRDLGMSWRAAGWRYFCEVGAESSSVPLAGPVGPYIPAESESGSVAETQRPVRRSLMSRVWLLRGCGGWAGWVRGPADRALCPLKVIKDGLMACDHASGEMLKEVEEVKRRMAGMIIFRAGVDTTNRILYRVWFDCCCWEEIESIFKYLVCKVSKTQTDVDRLPLFVHVLLAFNV